MKNFAFIFLLVLSGSNLHAQEEDVFDLFLHGGMGVNVFSLERIDQHLGEELNWSGSFAAPTWGFTMLTEDLQAALTVDRVFIPERENHRIRFSQIGLMIGPTFKLGDNWRWVPSVGWQINSGVFQRFEQGASSGLGLWISSEVEENAALLNNEISYRPKRASNLVPYEFLFRLQFSLPMSGPSLLELSRSQTDWAGARISSLYSSISLGLRYRIIGLKP